MLIIAIIVIIFLLLIIKITTTTTTDTNTTGCRERYQDINSMLSSLCVGVCVCVCVCGVGGGGGLRCTLLAQKKPISERKGRRSDWTLATSLLSAHARVDIMPTLLSFVLMSPLPKHCCMTTMYVQKNNHQYLDSLFHCLDQDINGSSIAKFLTNTGL